MGKKLGEVMKSFDQMATGDNPEQLFWSIESDLRELKKVGGGTDEELQTEINKTLLKSKKLKECIISPTTGKIADTFRVEQARCKVLSETIIYLKSNTVDQVKKDWTKKSKEETSDSKTSTETTNDTGGTSESSTTKDDVNAGEKLGDDVNIGEKMDDGMNAGEKMDDGMNVGETMSDDVNIGQKLGDGMMDMFIQVN